MNVADAIDKVGSWDEAVSLACEIIRFESEWSYYLGDIALRVRGTPRAGELDTEKKQQQTLKAFAKEIGQGYENVKDAYRVAKYSPASLRADFVPMAYGHWREITKAGFRDEADVRGWAERTLAEEWTITELRRALQAEREPRTADRWQKITKKVYRTLEEMSEFDLEYCWKTFPDETGLMVKSLGACLKTIEAAWDEMSKKAAAQAQG